MTISLLEDAQAEAQRRRERYSQNWQLELYHRFVEALDPNHPKQTVYVGVIPYQFDVNQPHWWTALPKNFSAARQAITWLLEQGIPADAFEVEPNPANDIINGVNKIVLKMSKFPINEDPIPPT